MNALINEINLIKEHIVSHYAPSKIILKLFTLPVFL